MSMAAADHFSRADGTTVRAGTRLKCWSHGKCADLPWLTLTLTAFAVLCHLLPPVSESLALRPAAVGHGELWRLWTGHFVHYNQAHAVGDIAAFAVWAAALEWQRRRLLAWTVGLGPILLSPVLITLHPQMTQYRGLSALDCALVAQLLLVGLQYAQQHKQRLLSWALAAISVGFALKTFYELLETQPIFAPDLGAGVTLLPQAHVLGIVLGAGSWGVLTLYPRRIEAPPGDSRGTDDS